MLVYKIDKLRDPTHIIPVEIDDISLAYVYIGDRREYKHSLTVDYFETWKEAYDNLLRKTEVAYRQAVRLEEKGTRLSRQYRDELAIIKTLQPPCVKDTKAKVG